MTTSTEHLGAGRYVDTAGLPPNTATTVHELKTHDGAKVSGVLRRVPGAETVVTLMHPRQDFTHHVMVPELLTRGYAVWTQGTRSVNNDLALVHEQAVLDAAAGLIFLREEGYEHLITLGHSGGGSLYSFYQQQALRSPAARISVTPGGRPVALPEATLPVPDGSVLLAPHPGQGALLLRLIDPSVTDESDPMSVDPDLDPYNPANGFATPPQSSTYDPDFVSRYRQAQLERVQKLDTRALELVAEATNAKRLHKETGEAHYRRLSLAPRIMTVYRTDADLRSVDLSMDPNERPYGSLFGRRPDLINYGLVGFGRLTTPEAWLSTWSGISSNATLLRTAPEVTSPTLLIELSGDQASFPADSEEFMTTVGATDKTRTTVRGLHFGGAIESGQPSASELAGEQLGSWLSTRYPVGQKFPGNRT